MNHEQFTDLCDRWHDTAIQLSTAYNEFRLCKHKLELAKAEAWEDKQVGGSNDMQRKASLYIIVEPFQESLITAEEAVMRLEVETQYLKAMVEFHLWNGIPNPSPTAFRGLRDKIDGSYTR